MVVTMLLVQVIPVVMVTSVLLRMMRVVVRLVVIVRRAITSTSRIRRRRWGRRWRRGWWNIQRFMMPIVIVVTTAVMTTTTTTPSLLLTVLALVARRGRRWRRLAQLRHQRQVLLVDLGVIDATTTAGTAIAVALLFAVLGNVADAVAVRAEDVVGNVGLVRTLPGAVVVRAAVRAPRAVILAQCAVEKGELAQLTAPEVVLILRQFNALANDLVDLQWKEKLLESAF